MTSDISGKDPTPRQLGYRWPAEWEPHAGTWIAWPHNKQTWPGEFTHIPAIFQQLIKTLLQWEPVHLLASEPVIANQARNWLEPLTTSTPHPLHWHDIATNDAWVRDFGPTFLVSAPSDGPASQLAGIDWPYNAWGGKYPPFELDQQASGKILSALGVDQFRPTMVLEGGAIEGNGAGTVIITESCLLNPNRNPDWSRSMVEKVLLDYLSVEQVIWLTGEGLPGDDTDGHIDQLVRFVNSSTVVAASCDDQQDACYQPLADNLRVLKQSGPLAGRELEVIPLPIPQPVEHGGQRLPASYCNFFIANGGIIVPEFDDPHDQLAQEILQDCFPDREVVGLPASKLVWGLGTVHCLTQQQPATHHP